MSYRIEHRLGIPAPAQTIWEILADLERWSEWNPVYPSVEGKLRIGEQLVLSEVLLGAPPRMVTSRVVDWVPDTQILWSETAAGGLVKRLRYLEIEALNETGCVFSNGEVFSGLLAKRALAPQRRRLRQGFEALGEALRARVLAAAG